MERNILISWVFLRPNLVTRKPVEKEPTIPPTVKIETANANALSCATLASLSSSKSHLQTACNICKSSAFSHVGANISVEVAFSYKWTSQSFGYSLSLMKLAGPLTPEILKPYFFQFEIKEGQSVMSFRIEPERSQQKRTSAHIAQTSPCTLSLPFFLKLWFYVFHTGIESRTLNSTELCPKIE